MNRKILPTDYRLIKFLSELGAKWAANFITDAGNSTLEVSSLHMKGAAGLSVKVGQILDNCGAAPLLPNRSGQPGPARAGQSQTEPARAGQSQPEPARAGQSQPGGHNRIGKEFLILLDFR